MIYMFMSEWAMIGVVSVSIAIIFCIGIFVWWLWWSRRIKTRVPRLCYAVSTILLYSIGVATMGQMGIGRLKDSALFVDDKKVEFNPAFVIVWPGERARYRFAPISGTCSVTKDERFDLKKRISFVLGMSEGTPLSDVEDIFKNVCEDLSFIELAPYELWEHVLIERVREKKGVWVREIDFQERMHATFE